MGMYGSCKEGSDEYVEWHDELLRWHNKRSRDILIAIVESGFGNRIKKLRIYAGPDGTLAGVVAH
jgi:hypothetical protein